MQKQYKDKFRVLRNFRETQGKFAKQEINNFAKMKIFAATLVTRYG